MTVLAIAIVEAVALLACAVQLHRIARQCSRERDALIHRLDHEQEVTR